MRKQAYYNKKIVVSAIKNSFFMLKPQVQIKNPVMFVTYVCALFITGFVFHEILTKQISWFDFQIMLWLWFTVLFANFAQSLAEGRGKAQADTLRKTKIETYARQIQNGVEIKTASYDLKKGDIILCEATDIIPADGEVIEGIATVDESAITGESAPVIRESGGDRSAVTAGTKILSDQITIRITSEVGNSFLDRMINLIEGAKRQRTPHEIALHIVLSTLTIVFLLCTCSLKLFADYSGEVSKQNLSEIVTVPILASLLVCLIPTHS